MMKLKMPQGSLKLTKDMRILFILCWVTYVFTYLGRLDYSACLVEIVNTEGWTKGMAGLIATGFFTTYGIGQVINGYIGDKISPKIMVALGLSLSGLINFLFPLSHNIYIAIILWCINGFVQSMIWSPLIRLLSSWLPEERRLKSCVNMNGTVPVGTLLVYGMSALLVYLGNWRLTFYVSGILLIVMATIWFYGISNIENHLESGSSKTLLDVQDICPNKKIMSLPKLIVAAAMPLTFIALFMQGMLKDGVTAWIPTFLEENFNLTSAAAILSTTLVPIINLGGVYLAEFINRRLFKNEIFTAMVFFAVGFVALILLTFGNVNSALLSLILLATTTTFMMGINTLLASMMPAYYVKFGVTSTVTGLLNASAYLGAAFSSYENGVIVENFGWNSIMYIWCICAFAGIIVCLLASKKWKHFRKMANELQLD